MFAPLPPRMCPPWWKLPLLLAPLPKLPMLVALMLTVLVPLRARASTCSLVRSAPRSPEPSMAQPVRVRAGGASRTWLPST